MSPHAVLALAKRIVADSADGDPHWTAPEDILAREIVRLRNAEGEQKRAIECVWVYEPDFGYGKAMRVVSSSHPRFVIGSRFHFGFLNIAVMEGYAVHIRAVPPSVKHAAPPERGEGK